VIRAAHLCFAATVTPDGRPNLSPKGTVGVWDDEHVFFLDLASPGTRTNLARNSWMEINVVEQLSRRGYRFAGQATVHPADSAAYAVGVQKIYGAESAPVPPTAVIVLVIERAAPLLSPAYWRGTDETTIRSRWRERRAALDREFEEYLAQVGPVQVGEQAT